MAPRGAWAGGAEQGGGARSKLKQLQLFFSNELWFKCIYLSAKGNIQARRELEANWREVEVINQVRTSAPLPEDLASGTSFLSCVYVCVCVSNVFIFEVSTLILLKNGHSLTPSVQLAAFNFIPAKFSILLLPAFFTRAYRIPPTPFPGGLAGWGVGWGGQNVFRKSLKVKPKKGSNFLLEYLSD